MMRYLSRLPIQANRFYFSQNFDELQKAKRKLIEETQKNIKPVQYKSIHSGTPYSFLKTIGTLTIPSLLCIKSFNSPYFSIEYAAGLSSFFDNFCLLSVCLGGAAFATTFFSKSIETQSKQNLYAIFLSSLPLLSASIGSTMMQMDFSFLSFLFVYLGQVGSLYAVQKIQVEDWSVPWMFKLVMVLNLLCFTGLLAVLLGVFAARNQEKATQLKLEELQRLSDLHKNQNK